MNEITKHSLDIVHTLNLDELMFKIAKNQHLSKIILSTCWHKSNYKRYEELYKMFNGEFRKNNITVKGKDILEIGSGGSFGIGFFFIKEGINSWNSLDKYNQFDKKLNSKIAEYISNQYPSNENKKFFNLTHGEVRFNKKKMVFYSTDLTNRFTNKKFDLIISNAVFEHIETDKVEAVIKNTNYLLKKNGSAIHVIDFRDHSSPKNPFNFYKYSDDEWNRMANNTIFYTNRQRLGDFVYLLSKNGFAIRRIIPQKLKSFNLKLNDKFRRYTKKELECIAATIICKKTHDVN